MARTEAGHESDRQQDTAAPRPSGADFIIPVLAVALVAYYSASTLRMAWEAKVTGVVIGALLVPLCGIHIARMIAAISRGHGTIGFGDLVANNLFNRQRLGLVALGPAFVTGLEWTGTTLGLLLLLIGCMLVMGVRSLRALLSVALVTTAIVYFLLIYLLNSRLPRGPVENLISSVLGG